jgi:hypothetical protein
MTAAKTARADYVAQLERAASRYEERTSAREQVLRAIKDRGVLHARFRGPRVSGRALFRSFGCVGDSLASTVGAIGPR